jgi:hypothetical protein
MFVGNGTADHPDAGLLAGNGFSYTADSCPTGSCNGGNGGVLGNGGAGYNGGNGGNAGWFGNGGAGGDAITVASGGNGGNGGDGGLFAGSGGDGGNALATSSGIGGNGGNIGRFSVWGSSGLRGEDDDLSSEGVGAGGGGGWGIDEELFTFHTNFDWRRLGLPHRDGSFRGDGANGVYVRDGTIYAATEFGVEISTDGGASWVQRLGQYATGVYVDESGTIYAGTRTDGLKISSVWGGWKTRQAFNGLGSNHVKGVYVTGGKIYAATTGGLSISVDGGETFNNRLGGDVNGVYVRDGIIYAATTTDGLAISTDGGTTWNYRSGANSGLPYAKVNATYVDESGIIYAGTGNGLSISTDGGATFTKRLYSGGCAAYGPGSCRQVFGVYATGGKIYAATGDGLAISTDGGATFTDYGLASDGTNQGGNGLTGEFVFGVHVDPAGIVYAAIGPMYGFGWGGVNISTRSLP